MPQNFQLRAMTPDDSPALAALTEQSPDGGRITFNPRFHLPPYDVFAIRHHNMLGVVAQSAFVDGLVGAAHVSFGECQFEGEVRPYALMSALVVHPDYRRQGIAAALAQWRIERALERSPDTLILADIQAGNVGSIANARKWMTQISGQVVTAPVTMRSTPPSSHQRYTVREAAAADLDAIADNLNTFYKDYNFYRPQTADGLQRWLLETPFTTPIHRYLVAVDGANRVVAGLGIHEEGRLMSRYVSKVPPVVRAANMFLKIIPPDGEMRSLQVEKFWFAPNQLRAARYLWQSARWLWRERGSSLLVSFDPRSPLKQALQIPPWMPTTSATIALRSPVPMRETRLLDSLV